jgi:hypothetical protein
MYQIKEMFVKFIEEIGWVLFDKERPPFRVGNIILK